MYILEYDVIMDFKRVANWSTGWASSARNIDAA